jgi:hypothetical protein
MRPDLMIDIETLATSEDAEILSIGWALFDDKRVLQSGVWNCQPQEGRRRDPDTVRWWLLQSEDARASLFAPAPDDLSVALAGLRNLTAKKKPYSIWANGVTFDLGILKHAYNGTHPWHYGQECCLRSIRRIAMEVGLNYKKFRKEHNDIPHSAEADAIVQAKFVIEVRGRMAWGHANCEGDYE